MMMVDTYFEGQRKAAVYSKEVGFAIVNMHVKNTPVAFEMAENLADYVLGHFPVEERKVMDDATKTAAEAIRMIITESADAAMNHFNSKKA